MHFLRSVSHQSDLKAMMVPEEAVAYGNNERCVSTCSWSWEDAMQAGHTRSIESAAQSRAREENWPWCRHASMLLGCWLGLNAFANGSVWSPDRVNDLICGALVFSLAFEGKENRSAILCRWLLSLKAQMSDWIVGALVFITAVMQSVPPAACCVG